MIYLVLHPIKMQAIQDYLRMIAYNSDPHEVPGYTSQYHLGLAYVEFLPTQYQESDTIIIFCNGFADLIYDEDNIKQRLADLMGLMVVGFDYAGVGNSSRRFVPCEVNCIKSLMIFMTKYADKKIILVGYSMGGATIWGLLDQWRLFQPHRFSQIVKAVTINTPAQFRCIRHFGCFFDLLGDTWDSYSRAFTPTFPLAVFQSPGDQLASLSGAKRLATKAGVLLIEHTTINHAEALDHLVQPNSLLLEFLQS